MNAKARQREIERLRAKYPAQPGKNRTPITFPDLSTPSGAAPCSNTVSGSTAAWGRGNTKFARA